MRLHSMLNCFAGLTERLVPGLNALLFQAVTTDPFRAVVSWLLARPIAQRLEQLSPRGALARTAVPLDRHPTKASRGRMTTTRDGGERHRVTTRKPTQDSCAPSTTLFHPEMRAGRERDDVRHRASQPRRSSPREARAGPPAMLGTTSSLRPMRCPTKL